MSIRPPEPLPTPMCDLEKLLAVVDVRLDELRKLDLDEYSADIADGLLELTTQIRAAIENGIA